MLVLLCAAVTSGFLTELLDSSGDQWISPNYALAVEACLDPTVLGPAEFESCSRWRLGAHFTFVEEMWQVALLCGDDVVILAEDSEDTLRVRTGGVARLFLSSPSGVSFAVLDGWLHSWREVTVCNRDGRSGHWRAENQRSCGDYPRLSDDGTLFFERNDTLWTVDVLSGEDQPRLCTSREVLQNPYLRRTRDDTIRSNDWESELIIDAGDNRNSLILFEPRGTVDPVHVRYALLDEMGDPVWISRSILLGFGSFDFQRNLMGFYYPIAISDDGLRVIYTDYEKIYVIRLERHE